MLFFKLFIILTIWFRSSQSISPGVLLALANLQNQRARSIANALNWRAKAQYNVALARTKANLAQLGDRRIIRNSREFYPDDELGMRQEVVSIPNKNSLESPSSDQNEFHRDHMVGTSNNNTEGEISTPIPIEIDHSKNVKDPVQNGSPTSEMQPLTSHIPNDGIYYREANEFNTDLNPQIFSTSSNTAPEICMHEYIWEKSAEADPHKHLHKHFHKHGFHHHGFSEPSNLFEYIYPPYFSGPQEFHHMHPHHFPRPQEFDHMPHFSSPVNVHVSQNQHIGEVFSNRPPMNIVPELSPHSFGPSSTFRSSTGSKYFSPEENIVEEEQMDNSEGDVIGSIQNNDENLEEDQRLGTFPLPLFSTNEPEYPYVRNPYDFNPEDPQNFQAVVEFIEAEQRSINRMIHNLDRNRLHYRGPSNLPEIEGYSDRLEDFPSIDDNNDEFRQSMKTNRANEEQLLVSKDRIGNVRNIHSSNMDDANFDTMNSEEGPLKPRASVPLEVNQLDTKSQHDMFAEYLENEQMNLHRAVQELQEDHERNLDNLFHILNKNPNIKISLHKDDVNIRSNSDIVENEIDKFIPVVPKSSNDSLEENRLGYPQKILNGADSKRREADETENTEILTGFLQNNPGIDDRTGYTTAENPLLGHIIQVPERRYSDEHSQRRIRSPKNYINDLNELLRKEKENIHFLKTCAKHDEDLMMIGYIEESFINDLESRLNTIRTKRQLKMDDKDLPVARLFKDPKTRFDMPKTLENLGAVARTAFEHEQQPMFHVRNMVGSAKDAVVAAMKIPNQNFVFPSSYNIVESQPNGLVGDINPSLFSDTNTPERTDRGEIETDPVMDTFHKVGSVIRESVSSGQEALGHVGDLANHAKSAIYSTRHALPKIIQKKVPNLLGETKKQTVIITPRIFDTIDDNKVGQSEDKTNYVKLGNVLDAIGLSNPKPSLNFEKITLEPRSEKVTLEPRGAFLNDEISMLPMQNPFSSYFENVRVENINDVEKDADFVGKALNNLEVAKTSVGAKNLKDFILKMRNKLQSWLDNNNVMQAKLGVGKNVPSPRVGKGYRKQPSSTAGATGRSVPSKPNIANAPRTKFDSNNAETVGTSFIPTELTHPFLNRASDDQLDHFMHFNTKPSRRKHHNEEDLGPVLGSINPIMFERIFNERLRNSGKKGTPHEIFSDYKTENHIDNISGDKEKVSTSMTVKGQILKPFMGQATIKNKKDFFDKYNENNSENNYEYESGEDSMWD